MGERISVSEGYSDANGYIIIHKQWKDEQDVSVTFYPEVLEARDNKGDYYFTYGAIVLALRVESIGQPGKDISPERFPGYVLQAIIIQQV